MDAAIPRVSWAMASRLVLGLVVAGNLVFVLADPRFPEDRNLVLEDLAVAYHGLGSVGEAVRTLGDAAAHPGGWYTLVLAGMFRVLGPSPLLLHLVNLLWFALLLAMAGSLARVLFRDGDRGEAAAVAVVALLGSMPMLVIHARIGWIHLPEAALLLSLGVLWLRDPGLRQRKTAVGAAILGGLVLGLRPSGCVWLAPMLPLLASGWRRDPGLDSRRFRWHLGLIVAVFALAAVPALLDMPDYLESKLSARARYQAMVPGLWFQLATEIGGLHLALLFVGGGLLLGQRRGLLGAVGALLATWLGLGVGLTLLFQVGVDNFPLAFVAAALGASGGWTRFRPGLALLPVGLWLFCSIVAWVPQPLAAPVCQGVPGLLPGFCHDQLDNRLRRFEGFGPSEVQALIQATCPDPARPCRIALQQGLTAPLVEDPGQLELFLMGRPTVTLVPLWMPEVPRPGRVSALARFDCAPAVLPWSTRYPEVEEAAQRLIKDQNLQSAWSAEVDADCYYAWLTPGGRLSGPAPVGMTAGSRPTDTKSSRVARRSAADGPAEGQSSKIAPSGKNGKGIHDGVTPASQADEDAGPASMLWALPLFLVGVFLGRRRRSGTPRASRPPVALFVPVRVDREQLPALLAGPLAGSAQWLLGELPPGVGQSADLYALPVGLDEPALVQRLELDREERRWHVPGLLVAESSGLTEAAARDLARRIAGRAPLIVVEGPGDWPSWPESMEPFA